MSLPLNSCHHCHATSYRPVIARNAEGVMRPSGLYQCSGCRRVFARLGAWRDGAADDEAALAALAASRVRPGLPLAPQACMA